MPWRDSVRTLTFQRSPSGRHADSGRLGFEVRAVEGGLVVDHVDPQSAAHRAGLKQGDLLLAANHVSFRGLDLESALQVLESHRTLRLSVASPSQHGGYAWVTRDGRPTSPPDQWGAPVHKVSLNVEKGRSLGLTIRGGVEYGLGVFVIGVDRHSAADIAGLQVGDEIVSVNEHDLGELTHDEAAAVLQHAPRMVLRIRRLGKVPCDSALLGDEEERRARTKDAAASSLPGRMADPGGYGGAREACSMPRRRPSPRRQTSEEIEEALDAKCAQLLSPSARISLAYYRNEYETRSMTVDALVAVLLELLDTPHKYALLGHLRNSIRPEDLDKFDELLYRREVQAARSKDTQQQVQLQAEACGGAELPSEDSGVDLASGGQQGSRQRRPPFRRHSSGGESGDKQLAVEDRRWSSVSEPPMDPDVALAQRIVRDLELVPAEEPVRLPRVRRCRPSAAKRTTFAPLPSTEDKGHRVEELMDGRMRVTVRRTKPVLGIAIEGGNNTSQQLPRIISIHDSGAASEAGGLQTGHVILEVQGVSTRRMSHGHVAKMIADAYYGSPGGVSLLVGQGPARPRRQSVMIVDD
ncbi:whirlin protein dyschronic [Amblyomma americanum]